MHCALQNKLCKAAAINDKDSINIAQARCGVDDAQLSRHFT